MKGFPGFPKAPSLLGPHHQIVLHIDPRPSRQPRDAPFKQAESGGRQTKI